MRGGEAPSQLAAGLAPPGPLLPPPAGRDSAAQTRLGGGGGAEALPSSLMASAVQSVDRRVDGTRGGGRAPVLPLEKPAAGRMLQESPQLRVLSQPGALEGPPPTLFYLPGTPGHVCPSLDRAQGLGRGCDSSQAVGPARGPQTVPSGITGGWRKRGGRPGSLGRQTPRPVASGGYQGAWGC